MKVLLTIWITVVLIQEVVPSALLRLPRQASNRPSTIHTEYEAKYAQKGKHGNESFSTLKGKQEFHHDNCGENWNDFAEKCAALIKDLIGSLAGVVSSQPGDATNLQLHIKNTFQHFDSTHNCSCLNQTRKALSDLDLSSLFNNITGGKGPNGENQIGDYRKNGCVGENCASSTTPTNGASPTRALQLSEHPGIPLENSEGHGDDSSNNRRQAKYPFDAQNPFQNNAGVPNNVATHHKPQQNYGAGTPGEHNYPTFSSSHPLRKGAKLPVSAGEPENIQFSGASSKPPFEGGPFSSGSPLKSPSHQQQSHPLIKQAGFLPSSTIPPPQSASHITPAVGHPSGNKGSSPAAQSQEPPNDDCDDDAEGNATGAPSLIDTSEPKELGSRKQLPPPQHPVFKPTVPTHQIPESAGPGGLESKPETNGIPVQTVTPTGVPAYAQPSHPPDNFSIKNPKLLESNGSEKKTTPLINLHTSSNKSPGNSGQSGSPQKGVATPSPVPYGHPSAPNVHSEVTPTNQIPVVAENQQFVPTPTSRTPSTVSTAPADKNILAAPAGQPLPPVPAAPANHQATLPSGHPLPPVPAAPANHQTTLPSGHPLPPGPVAPANHQPTVPSGHPLPPGPIDPANHQPTVPSGHPLPPGPIAPANHQPTVSSGHPLPPGPIDPANHQPTVPSGHPLPPGPIAPANHQPTVPSGQPLPPIPINFQQQNSPSKAKSPENEEDCDENQPTTPPAPLNSSGSLGKSNLFDPILSSTPVEPQPSGNWKDIVSPITPVPVNAYDQLEQPNSPKTILPSTPVQSKSNDHDPTSTPFLPPEAHDKLGQHNLPLSPILVQSKLSENFKNGDIPSLPGSSPDHLDQRNSPGPILPSTNVESSDNENCDGTQPTTPSVPVQSNDFTSSSNLPGFVLSPKTAESKPDDPENCDEKDSTTQPTIPQTHDRFGNPIVPGFLQRPTGSKPSDKNEELHKNPTAIPPIPVEATGHLGQPNVPGATPSQLQSNPGDTDKGCESNEQATPPTPAISDPIRGKLGKPNTEGSPYTTPPAILAPPARESNLPSVTKDENNFYTPVPATFAPEEPHGLLHPPNIVGTPHVQHPVIPVLPKTKFNKPNKKEKDVADENHTTPTNYLSPVASRDNLGQPGLIHTPQTQNPNIPILEPLDVSSPNDNNDNLSEVTPIPANEPLDSAGIFSQTTPHSIETPSPLNSIAPVPPNVIPSLPNKVSENTVTQPPTVAPLESSAQLGQPDMPDQYNANGPLNQIPERAPNTGSNSPEKFDEKLTLPPVESSGQLAKPNAHPSGALPLHNSHLPMHPKKGIENEKVIPPAVPTNPFESASHLGHPDLPSVSNTEASAGTQPSLIPIAPVGGQLGGPKAESTTPNTSPELNPSPVISGTGSQLIPHKIDPITVHPIATTTPSPSSPPNSGIYPNYKEPSSLNPTTFQTTSVDPTPPQFGSHLSAPSITGHPHASSPFTPHESDEDVSIRPPPSPNRVFPTVKQAEEEYDEDECCSCESCKGADDKSPYEYRVAVCKDLEEARRELKAIFDKIRKKLRCGRKILKTIEPH